MPRRPREGEEVQLCSFFNLGPRWGGWPTPRPGPFSPGKTQYPLHKRLVGPRTLLDGYGKSRPPSEFDPRIVQPVASRYTDYADPPHKLDLVTGLMLLKNFVLEFKIFGILWDNAFL